MSILGVVIAQVSRIQHVLHPYQDNSLRYLVLGKPQACLCQATACLILLAGAYRFLRQQNAMNHGYVIAGGWDVPSIGVVVGLVCPRRVGHFKHADISQCLAAFFLLLILIDIAGVHS